MYLQATADDTSLHECGMSVSYDGLESAREPSAPAFASYVMADHSRWGPCAPPSGFWRGFLVSITLGSTFWAVTGLIVHHYLS